ncbi:MAG: histidine decarboxylase [bacterium]|nr:histidine decarboxylase [bacterium]
MTLFDHSEFRVPPEGAERLDLLFDAFTKGVSTHLGYPANILYDYSDLHRFFGFTINNVGDPFEEGLYQINTHSFEREVITFFADLYHAPAGSYLGHVTTGGTDSNMYALYLAREMLPDGVVYYSEHTHYSIPKTLRFMGFPSTMIKSKKNGEIDYEDLEKEILRSGKPPIIVATIGTPMTGAVDQPEKIIEILHRNGIGEFYIHCDAALGGMILPFIEGATIFDFRLPIGSISVSGHKMIGSPIPCGIVIARKEHIERVGRDIEMIGAPDTTLYGSRNGHSCLFMWYAIQRFGTKGFQRMIDGCLEVRDYTLERLKEISWSAHSEKYSVTVVIKRPSDHLVKKWQLAIQGTSAHIVVMPNISKKLIDGFVEDLQKESAEPLGS